jgi:hypothetical protein
MACAYNPSYLRGSWLEANSKKVNEIPISTSKLGMMVQVCDPSYMGGIGRRWSEAYHGQNG